MSLSVLWEDNHLLVVNKPAGLLCQGDRTGDVTLVDLAKSYRREHEGKSAGVYVGLVHRLDRPTSGVVALAKTSKAARRLSEQFRLRQVEKIYHAAVEILPGRSIDCSGVFTWRDDLHKESTNVVHVATEVGQGKSAETSVEVLDRRGPLALLELRPKTGRAHQLRVQCASRGFPIVGDRRYGSRRPFAGAIALHAWSLCIEHPTIKTLVTFIAPVPRSWSTLGLKGFG